jgi:hypothetical protein
VADLFDALAEDARRRLREAGWYEGRGSKNGGFSREK